MEEEDNKAIWPGGFPEAKTVEDFDYLMTGKNGGPITKIPKLRLAEVIGVVGESMLAIQGGSTAATAVALPAGPAGQNRWFDASWGFWKYNNVVLKNPTGTDGIPEGNDGTVYWNGTTQLWSIPKMQALPNGASLLELWSATSPNYPYKINVQVRNTEGEPFVSLVGANNFPLTDSTKWKSTGGGENLPTYNKATEEVFKTGQSVNTTTGALQTQTGAKCIFKIPVTPLTQLYAPSYITTSVVFYKENGDFLRTELSVRVATNFIPVPADVFFASYNLLATATLDTLMVATVRNFETPLYIKPKVTKFAEYLELKNTADITRSTINPIFLNENRNYRIVSSFNMPYTFTLPVGAINIRTNDAYLNRIGILELVKVGDYPTAIAIALGCVFTYSPVNTEIRNKYIHASAFFVTDDLSFIPDINASAFVGTASDDTLKVATLVKKGITKIKDGLWRFDVVCRVLDFDYKVFNVRFLIIPSLVTTGKMYAFSNIAYSFSNTHHRVDTLLPESFGENRLLYSLLEWKGGPLGHVNSKSTGKRWNLYGTSIEASNYINRVVSVYNADLKNFGQGGGGVVFDMDLTPNSNREIHLKKCWSISKAEKIAEIARQGYSPATEAELNTSYDVSILQNLDASLFLIGTYGINDRMYPRAFATDQEFDRKSIYGAYNYVLRELFTAKPTAKVIIFGQHTFSGWADTNKVNDIQRMVAKKWGIPFLDWGMDLSINQVTLATYTPDGAHFSADGLALAGEYLITKLKQHIF